MANPTREIFVGVDSGTQSTKVLLVDGDSGAVLGSGSAAHTLIPDLPPGHLEQHPEDWFTALETALKQALTDGGVSPGDVRAIGVSGQQHGFVALDANDAVIRPAKLWCDTSTADQCATLLAKLGGLERCIALTGNGLPPGFTASKIAWLAEVEPAHYARLATVMLPHDYLNFRLTGEQRMGTRRRIGHGAARRADPRLVGRDDLSRCSKSGRQAPAADAARRTVGNAAGCVGGALGNANRRGDQSRWR
jgi:xylulokinase